MFVLGISIFTIIFISAIICADNILTLFVKIWEKIDSIK